MIFVLAQPCRPIIGFEGHRHSVVSSAIIVVMMVSRCRLAICIGRLSSVWRAHDFATSQPDEFGIKNLSR